MKASAKFNNDLIWNAGAFGMAALIGILVNFLIYRSAGEAYLGVFNQCYAGYILLSQLAVGGVHLSVQRFVPVHTQEPAVLRNILSSALLLCMLSSLLVILPSWIFSDIPGQWLDSPEVEESFRWVLPGLLFFSLNKVLMAYLNGLRVMKPFAVFQFLRFFFLLVFILIFLYLLGKPEHIAATLSLSEALLFLVILLFFLPRYTLFPSESGFKEWLNVQNKFGAKALVGNFLLDVNTRVDVFILGYFHSDAAVGIYSYASTFAEGFLQLTVLVRNNINPVLTRLSAKRNAPFTRRILKASIRKSYKMIGGLGFLSIIGFPLFLWITQAEQAFTVWLVYSLLAGFASLTAGYQPLLMIHNQYGQPGLHTWFIMTLFIANILFNLVLVPFMGAPGAALATGLSYIIMMIWLKFVSGRLLGFRL
jgi:O-antigen/teichoic acid export membrane protein